MEQGMGAVTKLSVGSVVHPLYTLRFGDHTLTHKFSLLMCVGALVTFCGKERKKKKERTAKSSSQSFIPFAFVLLFLFVFHLFSTYLIPYPYAKGKISLKLLFLLSVLDEFSSDKAQCLLLLLVPSSSPFMR
uniref:Uncharacterized protein n=1 Tax=Trypanosoma congolense (strain IL3000) TaxID=1068625 RepID=G0ULB9_TRYCI|nr:hypothetical protein, unlikely [Trypanosoma congolense IL3000]